MKREIIYVYFSHINLDALHFQNKWHKTEENTSAVKLTLIIMKLALRRYNIFFSPSLL